MPELTISLTQEEYTDLERIAEERLQDPERTAHDLLVETVADAVANSRMRPEQRAFNRGVLKERRAAVQAARWSEIFLQKAAQTSGIRRP
jgi:hypothetical protein